MPLCLPGPPIHWVYALSLIATLPAMDTASPDHTQARGLHRQNPITISKNAGIFQTLVHLCTFGGQPHQHHLSVPKDRHTDGRKDRHQRV